MALSERSRTTLHVGLGALIDDEEAVGEMLASIPRDVDELATKDFVRAEIHAATNKIIIWNIGWTLTLAGLILAAVRFA